MVNHRDVLDNKVVAMENLGQAPSDWKGIKYLPMLTSFAQKAALKVSAVRLEPRRASR